MTDYTAHTPGPWIDERWQEGNEGGTRVISDDDWKCQVCCVEDRPGLKPARVFANARLITAAPALLKEVKRLREAVSQTIAENRHLADGEDCTLRRLVAAMEEDE